MTAYATDYEAMGLSHYQPFQTAFTAVPPKGKDKPAAIPKKRGPKPAKSKAQQAAIALETPEERKDRQQRETKLLDSNGRALVDLAPRTVGAITIYSQADANKSRALAHGRQI